VAAHGILMPRATTKEQQLVRTERLAVSVPEPRQQVPERGQVPEPEQRQQVRAPEQVPEPEPERELQP
jgi:hypothetical protein